MLPHRCAQHTRERRGNASANPDVGRDVAGERDAHFPSGFDDRVKGRQAKARQNVDQVVAAQFLFTNLTYAVAWRRDPFSIQTWSGQNQCGPEQFSGV